MATSSDFQTWLTEEQAHAPQRLPARRVAAAKIAGLLPAPMRFGLFGLPGGLATADDWSKNQIALPENVGGPTFLARVENGIACDFGAHLTGKGFIIPELSPLPNRVIMERFLRAQRMFPDVPHRAGSVLSLALDGHKNFYHWMYEVLPRWRVAKASGLGQNAGLYAALQHRFHRESLALLGLVPARVIDSSAQPFLKADVLYVPAFVEPTEPWVGQWLRDALLAPALKHNSLHTRKRLYISRQQKISGKIANETELVELLKKYDFTPITPEDYALSGQIALFHAAQAIVAPHGSGLTNLTFSEPGTFVLELIGEGVENEAYARIAQQRSLRHQQLRCARTSPAEAPSAFTVDLDAVRSALSAL